MMMGRNTLYIIAEIAKAVEMDIAHLPPVSKFDAEFEGTIGLCNEVAFVKAQQPIELADDGHGRLTHPDSAYFIGFYEGD